MPFDIWLWMPKESILLNEGLLTSMSGIPQLKIKNYAAQEEAQGTPYEVHADILTAGGPVHISDAFRTLVLFKYGGVYFDMDILFLKDIRPLCGVEFFYPWSSFASGNSALVHFIPGTGNMDALMARSIKIGSCYPKDLYKYNVVSRLLRNVYLLPVFAFDPAWMAHDRRLKENPHCNRFDDFFDNQTPVNLAEFFPCSYAYHWHNRWKKPIRQGTIVGQLYEEVVDRFNKMFNQSRGPSR